MRRMLMGLVAGACLFGFIMSLYHGFVRPMGSFALLSMVIVMGVTCILAFVLALTETYPDS